MNGEIICVGTELLLGNILNTDARFLSEELAVLRINLYRQVTVGDNVSRLRDALEEALERSNLVILTGGLGPTKDDLTKETVAEVLHLPLQEDADVLADIRAFFARTGREMPETNKKQALVPQGAQVLRNDWGTAPGLWIQQEGKDLFLLPGPPEELKPMFLERVKPILEQKTGGTIRSHVVRVFGLGESATAEALSDLLDGENPTVATYAKTGEVEVRVTASAASEQQAEELCEPILQEIQARIGSYIYGVDVPDLQHKLVALLKQVQKTVATAESCTAGLTAKKITEVPGTSSVFHMGVVSYANEVKAQELGVPTEVLDTFGAVSPQTAAGMAAGIREKSGADMGLSITGVAGPDPSEGKPVGLVYIGLCDGKKAYVRRLMLSHGKAEPREKIRELAAKSVLHLAIRYLETSLADGVDMDRIYEADAYPQIPPLLVEEPSLETGSVTDTDVQEDAALVQENGLPVQQETEKETALSQEDGTVVHSVSRKQRRHKSHRLLLEQGESTGRRLRKILCWVAIGVAALAVVYLAVYFLSGWMSGQGQQPSESSSVVASVEPQPDVDAEMLARFTDLQQQVNSDIVGWLTIADTRVDYAVVHNTTKGDTAQERNDYYLYKGLDEQYAKAGTVFMDTENWLSEWGNSQNVILYGHNMANGTMFHDLRYYRDLSYYQTHPTLTFDTMYRRGTYKIFAVFLANAQAADDDGYIFNYRFTDFADSALFLRWIQACQVRSLLNTPVDIQAGDQILTLSTCAYDFNDARLVVMARKVRDGEDPTVQVDAATVNPQPEYPAAWYRSRGGSKPDTAIDDEIFNTTQ